MSKKHFIALADSLKRERAHWEMLYGPDSFSELLTFTIRFCAEQSPRFNAARFRDYVYGECGPNGGAR
jgi:hypothetical protein